MKQENKTHALHVFNPSGKDTFQPYSNTISKPKKSEHPPINFHSYAACTKGSFHHSFSTLPKKSSFILLLIRKNLSSSLKTLRRLKQKGHIVFLSFKECGLMQLIPLLSQAKNIKYVKELFLEADLILSPTQEAILLFKNFLPEIESQKVKFIPTPYPLEYKDWDFSIPIEERRGIMLGTREFFTPARAHLLAVSILKNIAREKKIPVTILNQDRKKGLDILKQFHFRPSELSIINGRLPYQKYLETIARHRLILQCDQSYVPGQVAGDCLLSRSLCIGGTGTIEQIAFPPYTSINNSSEVLIEKILLLLENDTLYSEAIEKSQHIALKKVSFEAIKKELMECMAPFSI